MKNLAAILTGVAILLMLPACDRSSSSGGNIPRVPEGGVVIDADVAGTRVFYGDHDLGVVPVRLTGSDLAALGLPRTGTDRVILESDGWGEGLFLGIEDEAEHKIHFLAPNPELYFVAQSPWGARTRTSGGAMSAERNWFRVNLDSRSSETVDIRIRSLGRTAAGLSIDVTAVNTSGQPFSGYRPELLFLWGSMDTPWRRRSRYEVALPEEWSQLNPNEERSTVVALPVGEATGGLSLFCVMHLFEEPEGDNLVGKGAVYGDSIWVTADSGTTKAQQAGTGQPATRPELDSEGSDQPKPESEGHSR